MLKVGDAVRVENQDNSGELVDEGLAVIKEVHSTQDFYEVEFVEEPGVTYSRFVFEEQTATWDIQWNC